jgi:hypothetical protein
MFLCFEDKNITMSLVILHITFKKTFILKPFHFAILELNNNEQISCQDQFLLIPNITATFKINKKLKNPKIKTRLTH